MLDRSSRRHCRGKGNTQELPIGRSIAVCGLTRYCTVTVLAKRVVQCGRGFEGPSRVEEGAHSRVDHMACLFCSSSSLLRSTHQTSETYILCTHTTERSYERDLRSRRPWIHAPDLISSSCRLGRCYTPPGPAVVLDYRVLDDSGLFFPTPLHSSIEAMSARLQTRPQPHPSARTASY